MPKSILETGLAGIATKGQFLEKLKWNGGKTLYEAIEKFRVANDLSVVEVKEILQKPDTLLTAKLRARRELLADFRSNASREKIRELGKDVLAVRPVRKTVAKKK
ncbi:MAG: hypothetical protein J6W22_12355 [Fibrobacter sp.]|nr:hypothetical protein [Fibrobacter sp.]